MHVFWIIIIEFYVFLYIPLFYLFIGTSSTTSPVYSETIFVSPFVKCLFVNKRYHHLMRHSERKMFCVFTYGDYYSSFQYNVFHLSFEISTLYTLLE